MWVWSSTQVQGFPLPRLNNLNIYWSAALNYLTLFWCQPALVQGGLAHGGVGMRWSFPIQTILGLTCGFVKEFLPLRVGRGGGADNQLADAESCSLEKFAEVIPKNINGLALGSSKRVLCHLAPAHTKGSGHKSFWSDLTAIKMKILMHHLIKYGFCGTFSVQIFGSVF